MWRGQEKGAARSGTTGKPFDEPTTQKAPAPRGCVAAGTRGVAALDRIADTPFARLLADRLAATQRRRFNLTLTCSNPFRAVLKVGKFRGLDRLVLDLPLTALAVIIPHGGVIIH